MCGLAGWLGQSDINDKQRLRRARTMEGLLVANAARGDDASGVAVIRRRMVPCLYKRAVDAYALVDDPALARMIRLAGTEAVIGHTRLGTHGKNIDRNAHPFVEGPLVGAHNGMIWNHAEVGKMTNDCEWDGPAKVDSQQALRLLASSRKADVAHFVRLLPLIEGSLALTWMDERDPGAVYLFRHENPLSVAMVPPIKTIFWSSQMDHLSASVQAVYGNDWYSMEITENTLYRMDWPVAADAPRVVSQRVAMPIPAYKGHGGGDWRWEAEQAGSFVDRSPAETRTQRPVAESWRGKYEDCGLCGVQTIHDANSRWVDDHDGMMLCGRCREWWDEEGEQIYDHLDNMFDIADTAGTSISTMLIHHGLAPVYNAKEGEVAPF